MSRAFSGDGAASLRRGNFTYFPVVPGRVEFSAEVRRYLLTERPGVVAIELPGSLEQVFLQALERLPELSVILYPDAQDDERAVFVPVEPADPFVEAARTAREIGAELVLAEPDLSERPHLPGAYPDPYSVGHIGFEKYIETYRVHPRERSDEVTAHANGIAWKLQGTDPLAKVLVVISLNLLDPVLDAMERPQDPPGTKRAKLEAQLINPHPDCLAEITVEMPYLQERYERYRPALNDASLIDRPRVQLDLLRDAEAEYGKNTGDKIQHWQRRMMARYTRNLAALGGDLTAGVFDLAIAARNVVDDNFAWEAWQMANRYPAQKTESEGIETARITGEEVWLRTKKLKLRRRLPRPKQRLMPRGLKKRPKEKTKGDWARATHGDAICSYPPEDLVIEDYGRLLKKKAKSALSEERTRVEPFTTSLLDGIDLRETIRNWYRGQIYVRQLDRISGEVGAVAVIFDEDREDRYKYLTTWLGENQNESDMAFYSTYPFENLVGPGIGRAEYGGFLMTLPPRRMYDVWADPDYDIAESKAERLLLAALDYSVQRLVAYVAAKPPRSVFRSIAGRLGRQIVYIPIGALSPTKLKRIRVVHVLDSYSRRKDAKQYLW